MAYTIISQNNTTTTLSAENGNVITVPARVTLATSTDYTIKKVNNNSVDLESGDGKIIRGVPACVVLAGEGGGGGGSVDYSKTVQKTSSMPVASADSVGQVYMYTGADKAFQSPAPFGDGSGATITIDSSVLLAYIQSTYPDKTIDKVAVRCYSADNFLIRYNFTDGNRKDEGYQNAAMLNQKGITVSGTPTASAWADSECLPLAYTHGYIYENQLVDGSYDWVRIDVQPLQEVIKVNTTVTLAATDWSSNTQTVSVTGMTPDGVVMVSPDPTDQSAYTSAGILCTMQGVGMLTFTCDTVPSADIVVTVVML